MGARAASILIGFVTLASSGCGGKSAADANSSCAGASGSDGGANNGAAGAGSAHAGTSAIGGSATGASGRSGADSSEAGAGGAADGSSRANGDAAGVAQTAGAAGEDESAGAAGSAACAAPADCPKPTNPCQRAVCVSGACGTTPADDGTSCTDGSVCTQIDQCSNGECKGSNPIVCAPLDGCHLAGTCDPVSGCSNPAVIGACSTTLDAVPLSGAPFDGYSASITIGGQTFHVLVDSQSSDLAVAASTCTTCSNASPKYTPGATAAPVAGGPISAAFGSGATWTGNPLRDQVSIGASSVTLTLASITAQSSFLPADNSYQGVLGLADAGLVTLPDQPFLHTLAGTGTRTDAYSVKLCPTNGALWLGGYNPSALNGALAYTPMTSTDYDAVKLDGAKLGTVSLSSAASDFGEAVPDIATTLLYLPTSVFSRFETALENYNASTPLGGEFGGYRNWFNQGCYPLTASQLAAWPPLTLLFPNAEGTTDVPIQIPASSYLIQDVPGEYCLAVAGSDDTFTQLGAPLFLSNTVVFDKRDALFGVAAASCP